MVREEVSPDGPDLYAVWRRWLAAHGDREWQDGADDWRIVPWEKETGHIYVTCLHHQDLRWSCQNLKCIGYKKIVFKGDLEDIRQRPSWETDKLGYLRYQVEAPQCTCPGRDLFPVVPEYAELLPINVR
jgi:hypothetical protein